MLHLNIIIAIIIIIIFILIILSNIKEKELFMVGLVGDAAPADHTPARPAPASAPAPARPAPAPAQARPEPAPAPARPAPAQARPEPATPYTTPTESGADDATVDAANNYYQELLNQNNSKITQLQASLRDLQKQNTQQQKHDDIEYETLGRDQGIYEGREAEFNKCKSDLNRIGQEIGVEIDSEGHTIQNVIRVNNDIINNNLNKIYNSLVNLKEQLNKDNSNTNRLLNHVSDKVYMGLQTNQSNIVNFLSQINNYVDRLQGATMNAMQKTLVNSINKIVYELMDKNSKIKEMCSKKPKHICDSIPECLLNSYGYDLHSCDLNTAFVV